MTSRKIVHVVQWLDMGGGESVAVDLATRQRARGDQVRVVSLGSTDGPLGARLRAAGIPIECIPRLRPGFDPTLWPALWARLARWRPQVVHTHDPKSLVFAAPAARLARIRTVHTKHGVDVDTPRRQALVRAASRSLDVCVAVSDETAELARQESPRASTVVIANGVNVDRLRLSREHARTALGLPQSAWIVGCVGRLEPVKGHDVLITAAQPLLDDQHRICLVGDGSAREALAHPHVELAGLRPDAAQFLNAFDVFAQPSRSEGLPLSVLEAMAASRPIVASAVGQMPKVLNGVGRLVPPDDPSALRVALRAFHADPNQAQALGVRARARVSRDYSLTRTVAAYDAAYEA